ncbi:MAG TPA: hypothetical protein VL422_12365, partial [Miltoncostaea sp.]|nr:hypothetical protein [Miltoncostaea sp.]
APAVAATGRIFTVAGAGDFAFPMRTIAPPVGDGGPAALARILYPTAVAALPDGGYLIADAEGERVRRVTANGVISTVAGVGRGGFTGDGGPAAAARLDWPVGVAGLPDGAVAISDQRNSRIRLVEPDGTIRTLAQVTAPDGIAAAADGGVLVAQDFENRVVHVDRAVVVTVVAGTGARGFAGDGGPATAAVLNRPVGVGAAADGGFLIADGSSRVRHVAPDGIITTVAGTGSGTASGDGGAATAAGVPRPAAVAGTSDGGFLIASLSQVRRVGADGVIRTVAGVGAGNFAGDANAAADAHLWLPRGVAQLAGGGILVADTNSGRVRFIDRADPGAAVPGAPRLMGASFVRGVQKGEAALMTRVRVACPPRQVAVRFGLARRATVSLVVTLAGRTVARPGARLGAGVHTLRFRVDRTGEHLVRMTAAEGGGAAHDQLQLSVNPCG